GPTGPRGESGAQGIKGPKGDTGLQGPKVDIGPAGTYTSGAGIAIASGVISASGDGSGLNNLNAGSIASGTLNASRLPATVPLLSSGKLPASVLPASVPL